MIIFDPEKRLQINSLYHLLVVGQCFYIIWHVFEVIYGHFHRPQLYESYSIIFQNYLLTKSFRPFKTRYSSSQEDFVNSESLYLGDVHGFKIFSKILIFSRFSSQHIQISFWAIVASLKILFNDFLCKIKLKMHIYTPY